MGGPGPGFGPPRLDGSGGGVRLVSSSCGLRVTSVGIRTEAWPGVDRAGTGFRSGVWGPAAQVLPPSEQGAEVTLPPGVKGSFRAGVNLGASAGSPVLVLLMDGLHPAAALLGAESGCIMGDVVAAGGATSETEESESAVLGAAALSPRAPAASSSSTAVLSASLTSRRVAAAERVSTVTSRVRGAASLGVVAWLVSVS